MTRFEAGGADVFGFELTDVIFEIVGLEEYRADQVLASSSRAFDRPGLVRNLGLAVGEVKRFHHLADETISKDDGRIAILVGEIESKDGEVGHLLYGRGRKYKIAVTAVASAFDHGKVIALLGGDVAEAGASAHDIDDDAGQFGAGTIGDAFLH